MTLHIAPVAPPPPKLTKEVRMKLLFGGNAFHDERPDRPGDDWPLWIKLTSALAAAIMLGIVVALW